MQNATKLGQNSMEKFDLVFLDAPYDSKLNEEIVPILLSSGWLNSGAIVVSESRKGDCTAVFDGFALLREVNYGINGFAFYIVKPAKFQD
jgi:16S rRNA G966 N2-methylase RsmD